MNSTLWANKNNTLIKVGRLKWSSHIVRIDQERMAKRILSAKAEGRIKEKDID